MGKTHIASWRDLTLLQFGSLLKTSVADEDRQICEEWKIFTNSICQEDKAHRGQRKKGKGPDFQVNSTKTLLAYFFAFTAVAHKRFLCPNQGLDLDEIVEEYSLDLLAGSPSKNKIFGRSFPRLLSRDDFISSFAGMFPTRGLSAKTICLDPSEVGNDLEGIKWAKVDDEYRAEESWDIMLRYLTEEDAPTPRARTEDAFAWLEKQNQHAYHTILNIEDQPLFDCRYQCEMGENYPRFLRQLDDWNPYCMKVWNEFQRKAPFRFPELSAALRMMPEAVPGQGGSSHV